MDRARWLLGTRNPLLAGIVTGFFVGVFGYVALALLFTLPRGASPGNLMPLAAIFLGGPFGAGVGAVVSVVVRRLAIRERTGGGPSVDPDRRTPA